MLSEMNEKSVDLRTGNDWLFQITGAISVPATTKYKCEQYYPYIQQEGSLPILAPPLIVPLPHGIKNPQEQLHVAHTECTPPALLLLDQTLDTWESEIATQTVLNTLAESVCASFFEVDCGAHVCTSRPKGDQGAAVGGEGVERVRPWLF